MHSTVPTPASEQPITPPPSAKLSKLALAALANGVALDDVLAYHRHESRRNIFRTAERNTPAVTP